MHLVLDSCFVFVCLKYSRRTGEAEILKRKSWYLQSRENISSAYRRRVISLSLYLKCQHSSFLLRLRHLRHGQRPSSTDASSFLWAWHRSQCSSNLPRCLSVCLFLSPPTTPVSPPQVQSDVGLQRNKTLPVPTGLLVQNAGSWGTPTHHWDLWEVKLRSS